MKQSTMDLVAEGWSSGEFSVTNWTLAKQSTIGFRLNISSPTLLLHLGFYKLYSSRSISLRKHNYSVRIQSSSSFYTVLRIFPRIKRMLYSCSQISRATLMSKIAKGAFLPPFVILIIICITTAQR